MRIRRVTAVFALVVPAFAFAATVADLYESIEAGDVAGVRTVLQAGVDAESMPADEIFTALQLAALNNEIEILRALIDAGAAIDRVNRYGSALTSAANLGRIEALRELLREGANTEVRDSAEHTPMFWALYNGHADISRELLAFGAAPQWKGRGGVNLVRDVFKRGFAPTIEFLIAQGLDVQILDPDGETLLHAAIRGRQFPSSGQGTGHLATIRMLARAGVDLDGVNSNGHSALAMAAEFGDLDGVLALLTAGADPDSPNVAVAHTPLGQAVYGGHGSVVAAILAAGADAHRLSSSGASHLHRALFGWSNAPPGGAVGVQLQEAGGSTVVLTVAPEYPAAVAGLLAGDRISRVATDGEHFHDASDLPMVDIVATMRGSAGDMIAVEIERTTSNGPAERLIFEMERQGAQFVPRSGDHLEIALQLLAAGADPNARDADGYTAIARAVAVNAGVLATQNAGVLVTPFVRAGGDPRRVTSEGSTPLMIAAENGDIRTAITLISLGADPYRTRMADNKDAIFFAAVAGQTQMIDGLARIGYPPRTPESTWRLLDRAAQEIKSAQEIGVNAPGFETLWEAWQATPSSPEVNMMLATLLIEWERAVKTLCKCGLVIDREVLETGISFLHLYGNLTLDRSKRRETLEYHSKWLESLEEIFPPDER